MGTFTSFFNGSPKVTWPGDSAVRKQAGELRDLQETGVGRFVKGTCGHGFWIDFPDPEGNKVTIQIYNCFMQVVRKRTFTMPDKCRDWNVFKVWAADKTARLFQQSQTQKYIAGYIRDIAAYYQRTEGGNALPHNSQKEI